MQSSWHAGWRGIDIYQVCAASYSHLHLHLALQMTRRLMVSPCQTAVCLLAYRRWHSVMMSCCSRTLGHCMRARGLDSASCAIASSMCSLPSHATHIAHCTMHSACGMPIMSSAQC